MRKLYLVVAILFQILAAGMARGQDFSNKGKEFWLAYSYHVGMINAGGNPVMTLYITSDVTTTYNVEIFGIGNLVSGTINAGQVVTVTIPATYFINDENLFTNKAIRVTAEKPVVVYSYITRSAASGATLCLPTAVLGREYISMNYQQISNEANSYSYVTIVAVEDNTVVEITPSARTKGGWNANTTYTVNLNKGQIYQVLGAVNGNTGEDLTGTTVRSIASATGGCKRIAVFSGSGKISIGCPSPGSSDNLYQQLYPIATWGKKYLAIPSYSRPNAIYRVAKSNPAANVYLNGVLIPSTSFVNNIYYEFSNTVPNRIESDQPICVAQYFTTQGCYGNGSPFDPDMIILNPVEQNIDRVTLVSSNLVAANNRQHHLHVIMKNGGTALSSFKLDGVNVPTSQWTVHPADPAYSYAYFSNVAQGYHTLSSDTGFNALAYGYADAETYGYSAGSNIKDLYQYVSVANEYATVDFPAACKGSPFYLSMTFPYQPARIEWQFNGLFPDITIAAPSPTSSTVVNGRTLYKYQLTGTFSVPQTGTYPIKIIAQNPTADGCSGEQEINYDLQVFNPPVADFNFATNGCVSAPVAFTDNSNNAGRPVTRWYWDFGDGTNGNTAGPTHNYTAAGPYNVRYSIITDVGCKSDTIGHTVSMNDPPVARFAPVGPYCAGKTVSFTDQSPSTNGSAIAKWRWDFGDGTTKVVATSNATQSHTYAAPGNYSVTLQVETALGCLSQVETHTITVSPNPVVDFTLPNICLPGGAGTFNSLSTISDGTVGQFTYSWNFGDASTTGNGQNPLHIYTGTGPYNVSLAVTSNSGCVETITKTLSTIYAEPQAAFAAPAEICLGTPINFTDQSNAPGSTIAQWRWDFGDGTTSTLKDPAKTYLLPGIYTVSLSVTSAMGCQTVSVNKIASRQVIVNALPVASFTTSLPGCVSQDIIFNNTSVANSGSIVKWNWNFGDATSTVKTVAGAFTHSYNTSGNYTASLQVETDKGCISSVVPLNIVVNPVPSAEFAAPDVCISDLGAPFADASTISSGTVSGWQWNFGDPNASTDNPNTSTTQNPAHHYTRPGNYSAQLIVTSAAGCRDTLSKTFTVNGAVLTPRFTIQNTTALCSNQDIILKDASQVDAGNIIRVEVYWDEANPSDKTVDASPFTGKVYTHKYPEFSSPASRTYWIRYEVYSGIVCVNSIRQQVTLLATPNLNFDAVSPVCSNAPSFKLSANLLNNLPGAGVFSGTGVSSLGIFDPARAGAGTHSIVYTYTGTNGCSNAVTKMVTVNPTPVADAGPDKFVLEGGKVSLTPKLVSNMPVSYSWSPSTWLNDPAIASPESAPLSDLIYKLTVTSDKGCNESDEVAVKVLKTPVIPNIFSPNGDGIHDRWEIDYLDTYPGCIVQIYNRYGQLIHRIVNYTTPWDGRINGKDAPIGTYYYVIDPKNGRKPITGYVDIIR